MKFCLLIILDICMVAVGLNLTKPQHSSSVGKYLMELVKDEKSHVTVLAVEEEVTLADDIMSVIGRINSLTFGVSNLKNDLIKGKQIKDFFYILSTKLICKILRRPSREDGPWLFLDLPPLGPCCNPWMALSQSQLME